MANHETDQELEVWLSQQKVHQPENQGAWKDTAEQAMRNSEHFAEKRLGLQTAIRHAMNELGVPTSMYPACIVNAVEILEKALNDFAVVDGFARHADDCVEGESRAAFCNCAPQAPDPG